MFDLKDYLGTSLTILGTVIGAGFISGREIVTFFYGYDPLISSALFATGFTVVLFILFFDSSYVDSKWFSCSKPLLYIVNLILAAGMLSALDGLYLSIFPNNPYPVLSLTALIVSNVVVGEGVEGLKSSNLFLTPIIVLITVILILFSDLNEYVSSGKFSVLLTAEYIGLNVFASSILFSELGKKTNKKTAILGAMTASLILGLLIFFISSAIFHTDSINSDMPLLAVASKNPFLKIVFSVALLFGIFTTLLSCHYPLYHFVRTKKANFFVQLLLSATIYSVSRLGFYNIVSKLYTIMGAIGFLYIIVTSILQAVFRSRRPKSTSPRQECRVSRYSS